MAAERNKITKFQPGLIFSLSTQAIIAMKACGPAVPLHARVRHGLSRALFAYGRTVGRFPWLFILLPVVALGSLGAGIVSMEQSGLLDEEHMPRNSRASEDQATAQRLFPDRTKDQYDALELNEDQIMGSIIFRARHNASVYDDDVIQEIRDVIADVKSNVTVENGTSVLRYEDLCGRRQNVCVVTGERLLAPQFDAMRDMGILTYPKWKLPTTGDVVDLSFALADSDSQLKKVGVVRVTFKLRHDLQRLALEWEDAFIRFMKTLRTNRTDVVFSASCSISKETSDNFIDDVFFVWLSLGVVAVCWSLLTCGGDAVSTRGLLVPMGVVSPALGVIGAMGLLSACGVKVVEMVWVMPFLVLCIGTTDMSILLSAWGRRLGTEEEEEKRGEREGEVQQRVGQCVKDVGAQITVSSCSVSLAFSLAYLSPFPSVASLGLYAGVSVMLCYISTMTFGVGCLAVHAHRVIASRHVIACHVTRPREQLRKEGKSLCWAVACGGSRPDQAYGDQSVVEKMARVVLVKTTQSVAGKVVIAVLYLSLLAASIYGVLHAKSGVELDAIVPDSSYTREYMAIDSRYFGFSFPVMFIMDDDVDYNNDTVARVSQLLDRAKQDPAIQEDFVRCWLTKFQNSTFYNRTTDGENFPGQVIEEFLLDSETYLGDVVLDENGERVVASRCYVFSKKNSDQDDLERLMQRMRRLADHAGVRVFAYHSAFLSYDQRLATMPAVVQAGGVALAALCGVFLLLFPQAVTGLVVLTAAVSTLLGMMGFLAFLHLPVSFLSMPHVIFNTAFALYFSVHVAAAYLQSGHAARADRVADSVARAAAPLLVGAVCAGVGVLLLLPAASYSFSVMRTVTPLNLGLAVFHGLLVVPAMLALIGPEKSPQEVDIDLALEEDLRQLSSQASRKFSQRDSSPQHNGGIRTGQQAKDSRGPQTWPPPPLDVHIIGDGRVAQRRVQDKTGRHSIRSSMLPAADYDTAEEDQKTPASHTHRRGQSPHYNTAPRMTAVANHYHNWPSNQHASRVYDLPFASPDRIQHRSKRGDYANSGLVGSVGRRKAPSAKRELNGGAKLPRNPGPRSPRLKEAEQQLDLVAGLDNLYATCHDHDDSVATLEDIHHVACTLSTNGTLGASQAYVVENFRDIPA